MTAAVAAKRRVLVVDDEENVTHLVSSALRFDGFETITADNGPSALVAVAEADPDLVVLDVMMPGMDGLGVLQNLRAAGSQVPVIFLTARDAATDRIGGLRAGADDYVVKPFSVEVHLTATEFELLRYLMRNERVVLSKSQILDRVWKYDFQGQSNIVELYIGYLRKKIDNVEPKLIHTIRGAGYVIKAPRA